jgi:hypothetical protein
VAEGKTIKRAAIPIMLNNSLLSEIYCQNNGQAPNRNKGEQGARISDRIFRFNPVSKNLSFT